MAVQGSGLGAGPDPKMVDQQSYDARKGAPKHAQTSFPVKDGMKDQNAPSGVTSAVSPIHPGVGPDASARPTLWTRSPRLSAARRSSVNLPRSKHRGV